MLWKHCSTSMTSVITLLWVNYALSLSTMACVILISLRQSEIAARRYGLATPYVEVAFLLCILLVRLSRSSWLGSYEGLARQRSYTSTLRCDRPQKLSSSSSIFCHVSCLLMEAPILRQAQRTAEASPIDLSDALEALLDFDD